MVDQELLDAIGGMLEPLIKEQREVHLDLKSVHGDIQEIRRDLEGVHGDIAGIQVNLRGLHSDITELRGDTAELRGNVAELRRDQRDMRDDLQSLKADVSLIPGMRRDIDLILESQQGINEKFAGLDMVTEDVAGLHIRVSALEGASRSHTEEIRELRLAK